MRQILCLAFMFMTSAAWATNNDIYPVPDSDNFRDNCRDMGGTYIEEGSDFFACVLPSGTTVACLDWYGCIAWSERQSPNQTVRDHRLNRQFGVATRLSKTKAVREHTAITRKALRVIR